MLVDLETEAFIHASELRSLLDNEGETTALFTLPRIIYMVLRAWEVGKVGMITNGHRR